MVKVKLFALVCLALAVGFLLGAAPPTYYTSQDALNRLIDLYETYSSGPEPRTIGASATLFASQDVDSVATTFTLPVLGVDVWGARGALITGSWTAFEGQFLVECVFSNTQADTMITTFPMDTCRVDSVNIHQGTDEGFTYLVTPKNGDFLQGYLHMRVTTYAHTNLVNFTTGLEPLW